MDVRMVVMEKAWIADMDLVKDSMAEMEVGVVVSGEGGRKLLAISVVPWHVFSCWDGGLGFGSVELEGNVG
jgi:hypothetical protein